MQGTDGKIVDHAGQILASFRKPSAANLEVVFLQERNINPFLRMLILGSVLMLDSLPE
jgi:hypothetical protein